MKIYINLISIILVLLFTSGCIQSIHPYYTNDIKISFEEINGYWTMINNSKPDNLNDKNKWIFAYDIITIYESDNSTSILGAKYFKIKDSVLVNYAPYDFENFMEKKSNLYLIPGLITSHSLAKIEFKENRMTIYPLDTRYVMNKIKKKNYNLKFYEYGSSMATAYLFVSESEDWVDFLNDNIENESLFDDENKLVFEKIAGLY